MRMRTACFARAPQRYTSRFSKHFLLTFQEVTPPSKTRNQLTDKNVLLINEYTSTVVYLSPTVAGKTHDKKAVDEAHLLSPVNSTLDKDTGFQGYEPTGILTQQPKKSPEARS